MMLLLSTLSPSSRRHGDCHVLAPLLLLWYCIVEPLSYERRTVQKRSRQDIRASLTFCLFIFVIRWMNSNLTAPVDF